MSWFPFFTINRFIEVLLVVFLLLLIAVVGLVFVVIIDQIASVVQDCLRNDASAQEVPNLKVGCQNLQNHSQHPQNKLIIKFIIK